MNRKTLILASVFLIPLFVLTGGGKPDKSQEDLLEYSGIVRIKDSEPNTVVVLEADDCVEYILSGEKADEIREKWQRKTILIRARSLKPAGPLKPEELEVISYRVLD